MPTEIARTEAYVRLLNEGTEVLRPVPVHPEEDGCYQVLSTPDYDPELERWEFVPGSLVRLVPRSSGGETIWVAASVR